MSYNNPFINSEEVVIPLEATALCCVSAREGEIMNVCVQGEERKGGLKMIMRVHLTKPAICVYEYAKIKSTILHDK